MTQTGWINLLLLLVCTVFFAWRGYQQGLIRSLRGFFSTLAAYVSCYFFAASLSSSFQQLFSLSSALAYLLSALSLFIVTSFAVRLLCNQWLQHLEGDEEGGEIEEEREPARIPAAAIGGTLGCLLGLVAVWLIGLMMDTVQLSQHGVASMTGRQIDPVRKVAGMLIGNAAAFVVAQKTGDDSPASQLAASFISDPVAASQQLNEMSSEEGVKKLTSDPRFVALAQKPEFQKLMENPSPDALLNSPAFKELAGIIFSAPTKGPGIDEHSTPAELKEQGFTTVEKPQWEVVNEATTTAAPDQADTDDSSTIYRWVDEQGKVHFSQKKPQGNYQVEAVRTGH